MKKGKHFILIHNHLNILPSFGKVVPPSFSELGLADLVSVYSELWEIGNPLSVVDSDDLLEGPEHGINVPKGVAVSSVEEVRKAIKDVFPGEKEVVVKSQILAGGRGLGTFKSGLKGGVRIVKAE